MSTIRLKRVDATTATYVPVAGACATCQGCGFGQPSLILTDDMHEAVAGDEVLLELPGKVQLSLLWNSWLKPLFAVILMAIVCEQFTIAETGAFALIFSAFVCGLLWCRSEPVTRMKIRPEVY
jgi:hypothetical protein